MNKQADDRGDSRGVIRRDGIGESLLPVLEKELSLDEQLLARDFTAAGEELREFLNELVKDNYPTLHSSILELENDIASLNKKLGLDFHVAREYFFCPSTEIGRRQVAVRLEVQDSSGRFLLPDTLRTLSFPESKQELIEDQERACLVVGQNGSVLFDGTKSFEIYASPVQMIVKPDEGEKLIGVQMSAEAATGSFSRMSEKVKEERGAGFVYLHDVELQKCLQALASKVFSDAIVDSFEDHRIESIEHTESALFCEAIVLLNCLDRDPVKRRVMISYENPGSLDGGLKLVLRPF